MATWTALGLLDLEDGFVLAAERYHPGRVLRLEAAGPRVTDLATLENDVVSPSISGPDTPCLILDTSDVAEGLIQNHKALRTTKEIGSAKKRIRPGDVLISRLRPYLRQVGYVDAGLFRGRPNDFTVLVSTEFWVLRPLEEPISFLVPFLLSVRVQKVLEAATEGGHHPRFHSDVLLRMPVPASVIKYRRQVGELVEAAAEHLRSRERKLAKAIRTVEENFGD